jgi:flagellin
VTQLNAQASFTAAGLVASQGTGVNANQLIITGPVGTTNALATTGSSLTQTTVPTAGAGVDFTAAGVTTLSAATAQAVLANVTSAIADVAFQRGTIGANINQLTAASNVASSESVNLTSAESSIRSTNYGQATSDLAKFQVLSQTGISALAQANSVQQEILKLLQ